MEDAVHGGDEPFQEMLVQDGVVDEVERGFAEQVPDVLDLPGGEIVDDEDLVPALDECVCQIRADVPGAARHQDPHELPPQSLAGRASGPGVSCRYLGSSAASPPPGRYTWPRSAGSVPTRRGLQG